MPGHKRNISGSDFPGLIDEKYASIDFTECEGLDDFHDPKGIIGEAERYAAGVLGSDETFFLINGSTAGVLSAISATVKQGGKLLLSRGAHKSAYNGMYLRNITPGYIFSKVLDNPFMEDAVIASDVKKALDENPDAEAVLIVSPTYEGRLADIKSIAEAVHEKGIPLIVDAAHGTHLSFVEGSKADAIRNGADIVIQSVHKTLPAPTQTALISVCGDRVDIVSLRRFLSIYQSSSPSYPLMSMIDGSVRYMEDNADRLLPDFKDSFEKMLNRLSLCDKLYMSPAVDDLREERADYGKLLVCTYRSDIDGKGLADILRKKYRIEPEMVNPEYALLMFTVCDVAEGYERVIDALTEIDRKIGTKDQGALGSKGTEKICDRLGAFSRIKPEVRLGFQKALDGKFREIELESASGSVSAAFVYMYPPGSPILAPGELITSEHIELIKECIFLGMNIKGIEDNRIRVVKNG